MGWRRCVRGACVTAALVGAWTLVSWFAPWPPHLFPSPLRVLERLLLLARDGRLGLAAAESLGRLARGYCISVVIGLPLGMALAHLPLVRVLLRPLVVGLQALPSICWLPLALLWFGLDDTAIIFVVVMGSVLAMAIATEDAVLGVDPLLMRVSSTFGVSGLRHQLGVVLPAAMPGVITGLKLGWSFAWRALLAGELLYVSGGLGQLLAVGRELMEISQVVAVMVCIVALGVAIDRLLFRTLEVRVRRRWGAALA